MLQALLSTLKNKQDIQDVMSTRRMHARRDIDRCVVVIMGQTFPVKNWSPGGLLISADERLFGLNKDIDFVLKFKLRNTLIDINHKGQVLRKGNGYVAIKFEPVTQTVRRAFQQVIDDYVAREFANSQAV
jgi:hypothetical protein